MLGTGCWVLGARPADQYDVRKELHAGRTGWVLVGNVEC